MRLCATLLALVACPARADKLRLTIDEAVTRANQAHPDVAAARKAVDIADAALQRSKAWLPGNPYFSGGAGTTTQQGVGSNYGMYVSQEFEIAGQRGKRIGVATEDVAKAASDLQSAQQTLAAAVKTAFVQSLVSADRITVARQTLDAMTEFRGHLVRTKELTDAQRIEVNNAYIQESHARRALASAQQQRDATLTTLRRLLAVPLDQDLDLVGAPVLQPRALPSEADLVARALRQRPDLSAQRHTMEKADAQVALTRREAIPNITISGNLSRFEGETLSGGDVGFHVPVFQRKTAEIIEAVGEHDRERLGLDSLEATIRQETIDARRACDAAAADLLALKEVVVPRNEENLQLERRLHERGDATYSEVVSSEVDFLAARGEYLDSVETYNEALIELERIIGGGLDP